MTILFEVKDLETSLRKAEKFGGMIVRKKQPVRDLGFSAYFKDTEGNVLGLFEQVKKSKRA